MDKFINKIIYKLLFMMASSIGLFPKQWVERIGLYIGRFWFAVDLRHRQITIDNLSRAYAFEMSPVEIRKTARRVFENLGKVFFEVCWAWRLSPHEWPRFFKIQGYHHMESAMKKGKGVLGLTAHFGNWELLTVVGTILDTKLGIVYRPLDFTPLNQIISDFRNRFGAELIQRHKSMRKLLLLLREKGIAALLLDQSVDWYEGVFVEFFGQQACTNKGMALLALRSEAPVVPVFLVRESSGFTVKFFPEIPLVKTGDRTIDIEINTQRYTESIESMVRQYPDQWFWVHRRWKTRSCQPWPRETP